MNLMAAKKKLNELIDNLLADKRLKQDGFTNMYMDIDDLAALKEISYEMDLIDEVGDE